MESMTGYGRGETISNGQRLTLQISSVNHRNCDLRFTMPRELGYLEKPIRDRVRESIQRGSVQICVELVTETALPGRLHADLALARDFVEQAQLMRDELGLTGDVTLQDLLQVPDLFTVRPPEASPDAMIAMALDAVEQALERLVTMRQTEGDALQTDLGERLTTCTTMVERLAELAPRVPVLYRERLKARLEDALAETILDEERLHKEVAWFADKADVCEELTRLRSHLEQARQQLDSTEPVGRRLDFLLQEMNREINTVGSKANDQEIAQLVVEVKAEFERMREQVQNIQ